MNEGLLRKIISVKRRTRDPDVIDICDFAEQQIAKPAKAPEPKLKSLARFDKTAYMRDYMRNRRAKEKGNATD